ncbi:hypothetical protein J0X14_02915 [Muricauda sp. CAU 1633]|uniref:hypothetical protein n=1 Tax=Allomuricauda sp. CAU 1633 TaxID=2816036 RepID=UPI001A8F26AB|nr:hypothetical protein [Muricauda sp. CAU 1633]MBO0321233.1 hypothetical protein [Muricauda sp. CAU 1633]
MKQVILLLCVLVGLVACSDEDYGPVYIRLSNVSDFDFENIVVSPYGEQENYGNLAAGEISGYKEFDRAYSYGFIELTIDGETYTIQPIDYVGETPLAQGNYTYQLDVPEFQGQYGTLSLTLVED